MDNNINIALETYEILVTETENYGHLIEALKAAASLDYTGEKLRFSDDVLDTVFKVLFPETYGKTISRLKAEKDF